MLAKIRILLLDDDPSIRTLLRLIINATADLELLEATADVAQLPRLCAKIKPHILLIGGGMKHYSMRFPRFCPNKPRHHTL